MSPKQHVYHEIFLHMNWHCLDDAPLLRDELEQVVHAEIRNYCEKDREVWFRGVGGTATHVHLVAQVSPNVKPSDFIGRIKGACSHHINQRFGPKTLEWQTGYGVVSFAGRDLPAILKYVKNQKEHHRQGTTRDALEKDTSAD